MDEAGSQKEGSRLELDYFKYSIVPYTVGRGIELNPSIETGKLYSHFIGSSEEDLFLIANGILDFFVVASPVETFDIGKWWPKIKQGGYLVLFQSADCTGLMIQAGGWDFVLNEQSDDMFFQVFRKRSDKKQKYSYRDPKPEKTCAVIRYGGFGDMIQMSSILPELKNLGYHITVYVGPHGKDIITQNPYIDKIIAQQGEQVPNNELGAFWKVLGGKYDKFVNLSESVEGTLLALPGRPNHLWPKAAKHFMMNINYSKFTHMLAGVAFRDPLKIRFYPTQIEKIWAKKQRKKYDGRVFLWVLSGSATHKVWPYMDKAIMRMLLHDPNSHVVLVGDDMSQLLERGWEDEPRVHAMAGKWSIRETLVFAETVDCVIGPETGVLNTVSMLDVPKILFLSHSSVENLSKYWVNCKSLEPEGCRCFPCHVLHYGFKHCNKDEATGTAECQAKISLDAFWEAFLSVLNNIGV